MSTIEIKRRQRVPDGVALAKSYPESSLVMSKDYNFGSVIVVPGPAMFDPYASSRAYVMGWPKGHSVACACLDCQGTFDIGNDHPSMSGEGIVECPDCGAMSVIDVKDADYRNLYSSMRLSGMRDISCSIPYRRDVHVTGVGGRMSAVSANDCITYRTVRFTQVEGSDMPRIDFGMRMSQAMYSDRRIASCREDESGSLVVDRDSLNRDGRNDGVLDVNVIGQPGWRSRNMSRSSIPKSVPCHAPVPYVSMFDEDMKAMDAAATAKLYDEVCVKGLGLPACAKEVRPGRPRPFNLSKDYIGLYEQERMVQMVFQYPGVVEHVLGKTNEDIKYANVREPGSVSGADAAKRRYDALSETLCKLGAMDSKLADAFHKCKTGQDADKLMRTVVFGDVEAGEDQSIRVTEEARKERAMKGKFLKTEFNRDPYVAAANVYTAHKLGIRDTTYMNQLFDEIGRGNAKDGSRKQGYPYGIVAPIETPEMMRFAKLYIKSRHRVSDALNSLYPDSMDMGIAADAAKMLKNVSKVGDIAMYDKDIAEARYQSTERQMFRYFAVEGHSVETAVQEEQFRTAWGKDTEECVRYFHGLYERGGRDDGRMIFIPEGNPPAGLFSDKLTVKEIHDQLSKMDSKLGSLTAFMRYEYSDAERERLEWKGETLDMRLCDSNREAFEVGEDLKICVGTDTMLKRWGNNKSYLVIVSDKAGQDIGCIEFTKEPDRETGGFKPVELNQIKSRSNRSFPGPKDEIEQYLEHAGMKKRDGSYALTEGGKLDVDKIGSDYAFYRGEDFAAHGRGPEAERAAFVCTVQEIKKHIALVKSKGQRQAMQEQVSAEADRVCDGGAADGAGLPDYDD